MAKETHRRDQWRKMKWSSYVLLDFLEEIYNETFEKRKKPKLLRRKSENKINFLLSAANSHSSIRSWVSFFFFAREFCFFAFCDLPNRSLDILQINIIFLSFFILENNFEVSYFESFFFFSRIFCMTNRDYRTVMATVKLKHNNKIKEMNEKKNMKIVKKKTELNFEFNSAEVFWWVDGFPWLYFNNHGSDCSCADRKTH